MKTNLLRIGLRLSLVVIALLCGVHLAWGQENTKVMHKIYTNTYGNVTIDCPSEVEDGGSFTFKIATSTGAYRLGISQDGKNFRDFSWDDSQNANVAKNITGTILIAVVEHTEVMIGEERYMLEQSSAILPPSQTQPASSSVVLKSVVTAKGKHYSLNGYSGVYNTYANITSITLPNDKFYIFPDAFSIQAGLTEIHAKAIDPKNYRIMEGAFGEKDLSGITLYVPAGSKANYAASAPWNQFKEILEEPLPKKYPVYVVGYGVASTDAPDSVARGQSLTVNITMEPGFKSFETSVITIPGEEVNKDVVIQVSTYTENVLSGISYSMSTTQENAFCHGFLDAPQKEVTIPEVVTVGSNSYRVEQIVADAFKNQTSLEKLTLEGNTGIDRRAFSGCTALKEIHCISPEPRNIYYEDAFEGVDKDACVIFVPAGASGAYKATDGWKDFKNIREEGTYSITRTGFEGVAYYGPDLVVDGSRLEARLTPESGYVLGIGDITVTMGGKKLDPMSKEFFYGTFGKDTLTIETVTGDVTITAKARKIGGDPFVLGDLTYRITSDAAVEVAGVKEDAYTKGRSYVIPSSLEYEGNNYAVTGIGPKAFSGRIMESITIPSSVEEVGTESFLDAQADEIHIQRSTPPSTVNGSFNILDKNKCRIYVPKGALAAYHTATWDWLGFPYILEEGDKYFDVDFELTGLTVKPFQPEIAISGRSVSFILVPDSGSFLPDSIEVWYPTGLEPCEYDAKTGKVTIATVKGNLTIKAKAIGALLPDKDTDITIGKDSTYTDGSTTGRKFNGVIGNDEELTRVKSLKIDTEDGKVTGITFKSLIVGSGSSTSQSVTIDETSNIEITLDGNNNLGKVLNQGSTRLLPGENTLLDALVENEGVFIDETGLLDAITGPAGLTIAQRPEKAPRIEIGSSTLLKVEASAEGEANLSYIWEKFDSENNSWKQVKPEVQRTKALSSLRSDVLSTNEDTQLEVSEAGKYRCLVSNTVNAVNSTLTAYSEVSIASSTPDPTVTFSVTLPSVEGAALSPLAGTYSVEAGGSFSFSLTLDTDCDQSTPMVKVGDKLIEPTSDGKYEIKNINSDITISITGIVKNATVGNAEVESNALKIWGSNGVLHIQSAHVSTAYIMTFGGQLYKALTLPIGETMITIPQGAYIIRIENQSYKIRF